MINKYEGMTAEQIARTLSPRMRDALHECIGREDVVASTNTSVALIDRGLVEAGRQHAWTALGREVAAFMWPDEVEHARLAAEYERVSGKSAAGLSADVLRSLLDPEPVAGVAGTSLGEMRRAFREPHPFVPNGRDYRCASVLCDGQTAEDPIHATRTLTRGERAVEAVRNPRPTREVAMADSGDAVWRVGELAEIPRATFSEAGDVWRIDSIRIREDEPDRPYAGLVLVRRRGGLPLGETRTAVGLDSLRKPNAPRPAPRGTIRLSEALLSAARTGASSRGQFVEYGPMREALRAAFESVGLDVVVDTALGDEPVGVREHWARTTAGVLRHMRDVVLPGWIEGARENHEALDHRGEVVPCWEIFAPEDIRRMVDDAAREAGVVL